MNITVVGGGNSTLIFATLAALQGHKVSILTRKPHLWPQNKRVGFENRDETYLNGHKELTAVMETITSDPSLVIPNAEMIFIAGAPIHASGGILRDLKPFIDLSKKIFIGNICAYGGFHWITASVLGPGNYIIFGLQAIPWICSSVKYGHTGIVFGKKANLRIATEDGKDDHNLKNLFSTILDIKQVEISDFLVCLMVPNNPNYHPPILYGLYRDWDMKTPRVLGSAEAPVFIYKDCNAECAELVNDLNLEVLEIVKGLREIYPSNSQLRRNIYGFLEAMIFAYGKEAIGDVSSIQASLRTADAYRGAKNAYIVKGTTKINGKEETLVVPNVEHRFFTADLPYGLCAYKDMALMMGIETPLMDKILYWNQSVVGKEYLVDGKLVGKDIGECVVPSHLGLNLQTLMVVNRGEIRKSKL